MADLDTKKIRACSPLLEAPAPRVVADLCDEIDTLRTRVSELEAKLKIAEVALSSISCVTQSDNLLWWQTEARAALAEIKEPS